jgi:hypothetical protein
MDVDNAGHASGPESEEGVQLAQVSDLAIPLYCVGCSL